MCPLQTSGNRGNRVSLKEWGDGDTKEIEFLGEGFDSVDSYGMVYLYPVLYEGETKELAVRPAGALGIALKAMLTEDALSLNGRKFNVTKHFDPRDFKKTRYEVEER